MSTNKKTEITRTADAELVADEGESFNVTPATSLDAQEMKALLADGYETETYVRLGDGERIDGYFLGQGTPVLMNDPNGAKGSQRAVGTWKFRHSTANVVQVIATSSQLDSRLPQIPLGSHCIVQKAGQTASGGRRVNNWVVLHNPKKSIKVDAPIFVATNTLSEQLS
jgi:hypothetical protein